ncbi:MAG: sulfotransferase domain-containing protein [Nitrospirales bacterium]|nr:sulfotransferase domain-containing protein [Nitrospirales bacterium]
MLGRKGEATVSGEEEMSALYSSHLHEVESWLAQQQNMAVLYMDYNDLIENYDRNTEEINRFFGGRLSVHRMECIVDKSLYRQRRAHDPAMLHRAQGQQEKESSDQDKEVIEAQLKALGYM